MDIHKPKPWHGVREFLKEYLIIVVGVLTALAADSGVQALHWRNEVKAAKAALAGEIAQDNRVFALRVAAGPCIARRLDELEDVVERVAKRAPVQRLGSVMPDTGDALQDNIWQSHQASQTVVHFDADDLAAFSAYYTQLGYSRVGMQQETENDTVLRVLEGNPGRLGPSEVAALRLAIQRGRFVDSVLVLIARGQLKMASRLHVDTPAPDSARLKAICQPLSARPL